MLCGLRIQIQANILSLFSFEIGHCMGKASPNVSAKPGHRNWGRTPAVMLPGTRGHTWILPTSVPTLSLPLS